MKAGVRALGIAESYRDATSRLAGVLVRASRVVDDFVFGSCTVGGSDATGAVCEMVDELDREDARYVFVSGIAPAWFNVLDLREIRERTGRPVLSITYEDSEGLESAIREAFDDEAVVKDRLATYRAQPDRRPLSVNGERIHVRSVGVEDGEANDLVRGFMPEGGRPEPLRVARLAARAADSFTRE